MSARLKRLEDLVKELSFQDDPDRLVRAFARQMDLFYPNDGLVTVNCRGLTPPAYRVSRSWRWREVIDPYTQTHRLPVYQNGLLSELLHEGKARLISRLELGADDPAREHFDGMRSLAAAPAFHEGQPISLSILLHHEEEHFTEKDLETLLLNTNLLGRAVNERSLAKQLEHAYRRLDQEAQHAGRVQRHLLPKVMPSPQGLSLASSYITCSRMGGDYYDVLPLPGNRWGLFLADISGHGMPAAVFMAIVHTLLHAYPNDLEPISEVLGRVNDYLASIAPEGTFATAFYGIYDPEKRCLQYALAGHPPPRLRRRHGEISGIPAPTALPLGVVAGARWKEQSLQLQPGDALLLYTDGLIEGRDPRREEFGLARLDEALRFVPGSADALVQQVERQFRSFTTGGPDCDDRTLLALVATPTSCPETPSANSLCVVPQH